MMKKNCLLQRLCFVAITLTVAVVLLGTGSARADAPVTKEIVGSVKTVTGDAFLGRGEGKLEATTGDHLYRGDTLITGSSSSMGVIFRDDTIMSLGSKTEISIDDFVFKPVEHEMNFLVKVGKGTAQIITGQMAHISPESMKVETPLSTIGIRGTRFLIKVD